MKEFLDQELAAVRSQNLLRSLREVGSSQGPVIRLDGREVHNFSSNDYLALASDPALKKAAAEALDVFGTGSGASRLISGNLSPCGELELELARFKQAEAALVFSSGYAAAMGTIPVLIGPGDTVILDKLCHACLIDAARLSGATLRVYPHLNMTRLSELLAAARREGSRTMVVTESVFSMDGDVAPLDQIVELKHAHGAWLMVDEAHATGVFGTHGRGAAEHFRVEPKIDVTMGTLGKALGAAGGYISGSRRLVDLLVNRARSFIFSTGLPPACYAAATAALRQIERQPQLREKLWRNVTRLATALGRPAISPILPVLIGEERRAVEASARLLEKGYFVPAVRYPTVARGKARLRISVSAGHSEAQLDGLAEAIRRA